MAGIYEGTDLADKTFYGFRMEDATSDLQIEIINDGVTPVVLPMDGILDTTDYKAWIWSQDTIRFEFNSKGHLLMKFI
jgi:hypothetical protein